MCACFFELRFVSVYASCLCGVRGIACLIILCSYMLESLCVPIDIHYSSSITQMHAYMCVQAFVFSWYERLPVNFIDRFGQGGDGGRFVKYTYACVGEVRMHTSNINMLFQMLIFFKLKHSSLHLSGCFLFCPLWSACILQIHQWHIHGLNGSHGAKLKVGLLPKCDASGKNVWRRTCWWWPKASGCIHWEMALRTPFCKPMNFAITICRLQKLCGKRCGWLVNMKHQTSAVGHQWTPCQPPKFVSITRVMCTGMSQGNSCVVLGARASWWNFLRTAPLVSDESHLGGTPMGIQPHELTMRHGLRPPDAWRCGAVPQLLLMPRMILLLLADLLLGTMAVLGALASNGTGHTIFMCVERCTPINNITSP